MRLVDTAGIRRAAKVQESVEYYTVLRSQRAAERADVALVVCDATDGVTVAGPADRRAGDEVRLRHGARAQQVGPHQRRRVRPRPRARPGRAQAAPAPARDDRLGEDRPPRRRGCWSRCCRWPTAAEHRIPTPELNRFLARRRRRAPAAAAAGPPAQAALHRPDRRAPAALLDPGQQPQAVTRDYAYFVENRLRERYALEGIPVIIDFVERKQRRRDRQSEPTR